MLSVNRELLVIILLIYILFTKINFVQAFLEVFSTFS